MSNSISKDNLTKLLSETHFDSELLDMVSRCLITFEKYHSAIYEMEMWIKLYDYNNLSHEEYKDRREQLDRSRTVCHNAVLDSINILNRIAAQFESPAIYDGKVSREQQYRREVADAVLDYVNSIIIERL